MAWLLIFSVIFSAIVFHGVFGLGLMENLMLHAALLGLPFLAVRFLMSNDADELLEEAEWAPWLFWGLYLGIAVLVYYGSGPTIARSLPLGSQGAPVQRLDPFTLFIAGSAVGLVVSWPVSVLLALILDRLGVWRAIVARIRGGRHRFHSAGESDRSNDSGFEYDPGRFDSGERRSNPGGESAAPDYDNALNEAQQWADQASSYANAVKWAAKFDVHAADPTLNPKDKLRYRLAAMLLRERLKAEGKSDGRVSREPTDAEFVRLGLPVPSDKGGATS